jgi:hypothetical protein
LALTGSAALAQECPTFPDARECIVPDPECADEPTTSTTVQIGGEGSVDTERDCMCTPAADAEGNLVEADLTYQWDRDTDMHGTLTLTALNMSPLYNPQITKIWFNTPEDISGCTLTSAMVGGVAAPTWELLTPGIAEGCLGAFDWMLRTSGVDDYAIGNGMTGVFELSCTGTDLLMMDACQIANTGTETNTGERTATAGMHFQTTDAQGELSDKASNCAEELFVQLASFTATPDDGEVLVEWSTLLELDNAGFYILRRNLVTGDLLRLNAGLIPAQGDLFQGAYYSYLDESAVNGVEYEYILVDVELSGAEGHHRGAYSVANPTGTPVQLIAPLYGSSELRTGKRATFEWNSSSRRNAVLLISSDPTFSDASKTMVVGGRSMKTRGEVTLSYGQSKRLEALARDHYGVVYWKVMEPTLGSQVITSPTYSVGYAVFGNGSSTASGTAESELGNSSKDSVKFPRKLRGVSRR